MLLNVYTLAESLCLSVDVDPSWTRHEFFHYLQTVQDLKPQDTYSLYHVQPGRFAIPYALTDILPFERTLSQQPLDYFSAIEPSQKLTELFAGPTYNVDDLHLIVMGEYLQSNLCVYRTDLKRIECLSARDLPAVCTLSDIGEKLGMCSPIFYKPPTRSTAYDKRALSSLDVSKLEAKEWHTRFNDVYPFGIVLKHDVQYSCSARFPDVDEARPTKRARIARDEEDSSSFLVRLHNKHKLSQKQLPSVEGLRAFFYTPLEESEKIPISQELFDHAFSRGANDMCTKKEVSAVFKVGDVGPASVPFIRVLDAPNLSCTEAGYHHCWDDNIRNILQVLIPEGECVRHSHFHSETRNSLPDFGYLINKRCVFQGEEKGPTSPGDPAVELVQNTVWAYDSAPYILGYYADKTIITFVALVHENGKTRCIGLSEINLKFITDRISNLQRLINMCSILPQLAKMVQKPSPEYATVENDGFPPRIDGLTRVQHLKTVYRLLKEADVPNTDSLVSAKDNVVFLEPIGLAVSPNTVGQLKECILCILDALIKAHEIPLYHRDIRKDNVLRCIDDESKWFLIDWEDASTTPTYARPTFSRLTHSPAIREDGHGPEVDIWGVGYLIKNANGPISKEIRDLGARICDDSLILTAHETRELVTAVFPASL